LGWTGDRAAGSRPDGGERNHSRVSRLPPHVQSRVSLYVRGNPSHPYTDPGGVHYGIARIQMTVGAVIDRPWRLAIFSEVVSNGVRIGVSNFCTSLREWSCTRNVTLNSPPRLGGVAAPSINAAKPSLAGADGVVDQCCEATYRCWR